jgi:SAM-dependent methyltransferase
MLSPTQLLAVFQPWSEIAEGIHRRLASLVDETEGQEVLWVGSGSGRSVLWWGERFGGHTIGVDPDPGRVDEADAAARTEGMDGRVGFQLGDPADLPFEENVFDVVIADFLHLHALDGDAVVGELGRVARPMGTVAAMVPVWLATPEPRHASAMGALGIRPKLLMEWKQRFREAGVVEIAVESAAQDGGWLAHGPLGIVARAWRVARWNGLRAMLRREVRLLRALARRRILGFSIVKGTRWPHEE